METEEWLRQSVLFLLIQNIFQCSNTAVLRIMGGIFTSVMPETRYTLIQSMTVFGVTMGALIGLALTNISAYIHLFIMSVILYKALETIGKIFPVSWEYRLMAENDLQFGSLLPLLLIFVSAIIICSILLRKVDK